MWELGSALEERPFFFPKRLWRPFSAEMVLNLTGIRASLSDLWLPFWQHFDIFCSFLVSAWSICYATPLTMVFARANLPWNSQDFFGVLCMPHRKSKNSYLHFALHFFQWQHSVNYANFAYLQEFFLALLPTVAETLLVDDAFLTSTNGAGQMVTRQTKELPCVEPCETKSCRFAVSFRCFFCIWMCCICV